MKKIITVIMILIITPISAKVISKEIEDLKIKEMVETRKNLYMEKFKVKVKLKNKIINIENHYIDKEKGLIKPYKEISEKDVGWSPTELPYFYDPYEPVNYYYPVEFLGFEDMMVGIENGIVKEFKLKTANQEGSMIYSKCEKDEGQYGFYIHCSNGGDDPVGADGYLNFYIKKGTKDITGHFSYFGRNEIIKTKDGKGYIYGVYK
jgi:hypothetical protein